MLGSIFGLGVEQGTIRPSVCKKYWALLRIRAISLMLLAPSEIHEVDVSVWCLELARGVLQEHV